MRHKDKAEEVTKQLIEMGHKVRVPADSMKTLRAHEVFDDKTYSRIHEHFIRSWIFSAIPWADLILIINRKNDQSEHYIGINTSMEFGVALYLQKPIVTLYDYEKEKQEELAALKIPSISGKLEALSHYYEN